MIIFLGLILVGLIEAFPDGLIGLLILVAFGLLFIRVVLDRLKNKEDDFYSKNVEK
jgi:hypothetical protein